MLSRELILNRLNVAKAELFARYSIVKIGLFGSYQTGTMTDSSDIDLLYELGDNRRLKYHELFELEVYLSNLFDGKKTDLINIRYLNPVVASQIKDAVSYV